MPKFQDTNLSPDKNLQNLFTLGYPVCTSVTVVTKDRVVTKDHISKPIIMMYMNKLSNQLVRQAGNKGLSLAGNIHLVVYSTVLCVASGAIINSI